MFVLTSLRKAGCLANLAKSVPKLEEFVYNMWALKQKTRWVPFLKRKDLSVMMTCCFPKARYCDLTHCYPLEAGMSDSSNGCIGSNQAYDRWAKWSLENLDVHICLWCHKCIKLVHVVLLWKSLITLCLCASYFSDFIHCLPEQWVSSNQFYLVTGRITIIACIKGSGVFAKFPGIFLNYFFVY